MQRKCKVRFRLDNTSNIQQEPTELSTYHVPIKLEKKFNSLFTYHLHTKDKCYSQKKMLSTKYFSHPSFIIMQDLVSLLICKHHKLTCVFTVIKIFIVKAQVRSIIRANQNSCNNIYT